jgi:hypothetical protein
MTNGIRTYKKIKTYKIIFMGFLYIDYRENLTPTEMLCNIMLPSHSSFLTSSLISSLAGFPRFTKRYPTSIATPSEAAKLKPAPALNANLTLDSYSALFFTAGCLVLSFTISTLFSSFTVT